jgi:hypothetical protein
MSIAISTTGAIFVLAAAPLTVERAAKLPPYAQALRCAGLAEAAAGLSNASSAAGRRHFDGAIFWGLATSEAARKANLPAERFTIDQQQAAALGRNQLEVGDVGALAELAACLKRVPPLR